MPTKTVYILGAGASVSANLPMQAWLLSEVYSLSLSSFDIPAQDGADFLSLPLNNKLQRMQEFYSKKRKFTAKSLCILTKDSISYICPGGVEYSRNTAIYAKNTHSGFRNECFYDGHLSADYYPTEGL